MFSAVMRNHFPKMPAEEIQAIAARMEFLINYLTGFIAGRRSSIPQALFNVEVSAEYAALSYMLNSMDRTGDKLYMGALGDASRRATKNEAEAAPAVPSKAS